MFVCCKTCIFFLFTFLFIYLFNSLFTVDFSIVITTNLHRLTENFILKEKFKNILKVATRGAFRIQSKLEMEILSKTVNAYKRWNIFSKGPTSDALHQQSDCTFSHNLTSLLTMLQILSSSPCVKDCESCMGQENSCTVNMPQFIEIRRRERKHTAHST